MKENVWLESKHGRPVLISDVTTFLNNAIFWHNGKKALTALALTVLKEELVLKHPNAEKQISSWEKKAFKIMKTWEKTQIKCGFIIYART